MASVFLSALFALSAATAGPRPPAGPAPLDVRCYRLMAALAGEDDPQVRAAGITGAQYFLGRIDVDAPGFDPAAPTPDEGAGAARAQLIGQCSALMQAGGRDFHSLGQRLVSDGPTV